MSFLRCLLIIPLLAPTTSLIATSAAQGGEPAERFVFQDDNKQQQSATGQVLVEAVDGGVLLQTSDGTIQSIASENIADRKKTDKEFTPITPEELGMQLRRELGPRFNIILTKHYVICSDAGKTYARWCGTLFERLYAGFENYWDKRGLKLVAPTFPLAAIVFANQKDFAAYATTDAGPEVATAKGYYSLKTNRIVLYDLSGTTRGKKARSVAEINRRMSRTPFNTATVIHEATHQIAFNRNLHTRYADNPLWLTEGMAMYFETPDLRSRSGWKTIGKVNPLRMKRFKKQLARRQETDSIVTLIQTDKRLLDAAGAEDAYADAWALSYFLIKTRGDAYVRYLKTIAAKKRLIPNSPEQRVADFQAAFGDDFSELERDWRKFLRRAK